MLLAYGFRPFFLLAGLYAVVAITAWLWMFSGGTPFVTTLLPQFWHGHEMIFGFVAAAVAGFLLTAVPSWTGQRSIAGARLALLAALWLAGRLAMFFVDDLPWAVVFALELAFLPALIVAIAPALLRTVNRNRPLLLLLLAVWASDIAFLLGAMNSDMSLMQAAIRGALGLVLVLVTIIGGRIVPAFTENALRARGVEVNVKNSPLIEKTIWVIMLAFVVGDVLDPFGVATAIIAGVAALLHLWRLSRWHGLKTASMPIVWVLHLAYLWLPLGLALKAVFITTGAAWSSHWQHALGAGAAATMILAVITRASLGHTGRPLQVSRAIAVAYGLLALAVLLRVFGPAGLALDYEHTVIGAGMLWLLSFGQFVWVYAPVLLGPRVDGKPG